MSEPTDPTPKRVMLPKLSPRVDDALRTLAVRERRPVAQMGAILLEEALMARREIR